MEQKNDVPVEIFTRLAAVYNIPAYMKTSEMTETDRRQLADEHSSGNNDGNNREESNSSDDVTRSNRPDRFRYTYELDHYRRNAMLIITNDFTPDINNTVQRLTDTFQKFRFEVDMIFESSMEYINRRCDEFFGRDFTSYGALVVVVIPRKFTSTFKIQNTMIETHIMQHFMKCPRPTLEEKPIIYIAADNDLTTIRNKDLEQFQHLLSLRLPNLKQYPFEHTPFFDNLINQLNNMADGEDLMKILDNVNREAIDRIKAENALNNETNLIEIPSGSGNYWAPKTRYIELNSTLSKRILLYRTPVEEEQ